MRGIYALLDRSLCADLPSLADAVLRGGVRLVQYRDKAGVDRALVRDLHARCRAAGALLIVNDDVAAAADADGVHLGQEDLAPLDASELRRKLGGKLLGISCGTPAEARAAAELADYVGVGPFAVTATKADAGAPLGRDGLAAVVAASALPVAAIGGIGLAALAEVAWSGAAMAAVASAIAGAADPESATRALVERWRALAP